MFCVQKAESVYTKGQRKEHGRYHGVLSLGQLTPTETHREGSKMAPSQKSLQGSLEGAQRPVIRLERPLKRYSSLEKKIGSREMQKI